MDSAKWTWCLVVLLLLGRVTPNPNTLQKHDESQRQREASNLLSAQGLNQEHHRGDQAVENQSTLADNKNNQYVGAQDTGTFLNQDADKKILDDSKHFGSQSFNHDSGEKNHDVSEKKGHKKGHHNSGYRNSYHKDEVSNNSSFFDDYVDEGGRSNFEQSRGRFGNEAGGRYNHRKEDGIQQIYDNNRQGSYDRRGGTDARNADSYNYDRKRYNDDRRDLSHQHRGQNIAARDRSAEHAEIIPPYRRPYYDRYRPHHFYDERPPVPPPYRRREYLEEPRKQTITIYEDPRIDDHHIEDRGVLKQGSEYIELDVRPGLQRYQRFDSFHSPPRQWGINRSDINPLVFNYNRY